jgi:putative MATE family efflux protein
MVLGITQGFGVLFAQYFGAGDHDGLMVSLSAGLRLSFWIGAGLSLAGAFTARPVLALMRTPPELLDSSALYLQILLGGLLITFFYNFFAAALRGLGNSRTPMLAMIGASVGNIVLDIVFIKYLHRGIEGVAIATLIAQGFSCAVCLHKLAVIFAGRLPRDFLYIKTKNQAAELLRMGCPMALRNGINALGGLFFQVVVNGYGAVFIAGISAPWKVYGLLEVVGGGYEGAVASFVAQNHGARRPARVKAGINSARLTMLIASFMIAAVVFFFGRSLLGLLIAGADAETALTIGKRQLDFMAATLPSLYMLLLYRAALQGVGNAFAPMLSGFMELFMRVAGILTLPHFFGEWGVYTAQVAGCPAAALLLFICYRMNRIPRARLIRE